jgi:hypothetical protein
VRTLRTNPVPSLFAVFMALIGIAWVFAAPPGVGPDEPAHYIKALGVGGGQLYGRPPGVRVSQADVQALVKGHRSAKERAQVEAFLRAGPPAQAPWQTRTSRKFTVPAGMGLSAFGCGGQAPSDLGHCIGDTSTNATDRDTYVGTYQPFMYALPGVVMRTTSAPVAALRLGRLVNAALSLGLLVVATLVLWDRSRAALSLVGMAVAVTPAVVFFASILNPSGPELASGICFAACLLRLARSTDASGWVWVACAGSGAVLGLGRSLGPLFVVLMVASVVVLVGWRRALSVLTAAPGRAAVTAATVALAAVVGTVWERTRQPHLPVGPGAVRKGLDPAIDILPGLSKEAVGVFGADNIFMPLTFYVVWWLMLAVLLAAALYVGRGLERASLPALALAIVLVTVVVAAVVRQSGYELQGRYVLPYAVLLPLWAGELLSRHRERLHPRAARALLVSVTAGAAMVQAGAWYTHGHRVSVGAHGDWLFASRAGWVPPLGWWTWIAVVLAAAGVYVLAGLRAGEVAAGPAPPR